MPARIFTWKLLNCFAPFMDNSPAIDMQYHLYHTPALSKIWVYCVTLFSISCNLVFEGCIVPINMFRYLVRIVPFIDILVIFSYKL